MKNDCQFNLTFFFPLISAKEVMLSALFVCLLLACMISQKLHNRFQSHLVGSLAVGQGTICFWCRSHLRFERFLNITGFFYRLLHLCGGEKNKKCILLK